MLLLRSASTRLGALLMRSSSSSARLRHGSTGWKPSLPQQHRVAPNTFLARRYLARSNLMHSQAQTVSGYQGMKLAEFSKQMGVPVRVLAEIVAQVQDGKVNGDTALTSDLMELLAEEYDMEFAQIAPPPPKKEKPKKSATAKKNNAVPAKGKPSSMPSTLERPPIVTIMGHVDHGKTTLLDAYRSSSIAAGEAGGITQHIGAFMVELGDAQRITFLDTPGHAAFSAMRQRGASATDVVILVVAADDGVMPQTIESIKYATEAGVPLVVAINKCDKEQADVHRVKQELARHGVDLEDFGGAVQAVPVSALQRKNLDALLEAVLLQAEVRGTQGKASNPAEGVVIEASSDKFKGQVATVLLHDGSLKPGEYIAAGCSFARIKSMTDDGKQRLKSLQPSMAAEVMGWRSLPEVGVPVFKVASEKEARAFVEEQARLVEEEKNLSAAEIVDRRRQMAEEHRQETLQERRRLRRLPRSARPRELNQQELLDVASSDKPTRLLVVRSDVQGSAEALVDAIAAIPSSEVACQVIRQGVGNITDSDIELAATTNATILGFGVGLGKKEAAQAEQQGVQVKLYKVVYHLLEELEQDLLSMLPPLMVEKQVGKAKVLQVFNLTGKRKSTVAGCRVLTGSLVKAHRFKVLRKGEEIHEGELSQLMHHKDSVEEVGLNTECGLSFEDYSDFAADDEVVCYQIEEKRRERL